MRKKELSARLAFGTALTSAALGLASCGRPENVYGPPEYYESNVSSENIETVYGPPEYFGYDPSKEEIEDVYGPPVEDWDAEDTEEAEETEASDEESTGEISQAD